jgi:hypothetical protein
MIRLVIIHQLLNSMVAMCPIVCTLSSLALTNLHVHNQAFHAVALTNYRCVTIPSRRGAITQLKNPYSPFSTTKTLQQERENA